MIDVHMILLGDENPEWLAQCIQSLADEPVALHIVRGQFGHIGKWRAKGFRLGTNPYVSYVDPDDYVLPGAYAGCLKALAAHPDADAAYADTVVETPGGVQVLDNPLHHMCVYRRRYADAVLSNVAAEPLVPERYIETHSLNKQRALNARGEPIAGYVYRNRTDSPAKRLLADYNAPRGTFTPLEGA